MIHRDQLYAAGCGWTRIRSWRRTGTLVEVHPGVFAYGRAELGYRTRVRAALLFAGPGSALAGATAAHWWGVIEHQPLVIELVSPRHVRSRYGLTVHRVTAPSFVEHRGMPVTTVPDTLLRLASAGASHSDLRRMLAEAEYRRLIHVEDALEVLGRGRRGTAKLRRALESHQPLLARARTRAERSFIALLETSGEIPMPEINVRIGRMTVDALWREQRLVVEIDGGDNHGTPGQIDRDHRRDLHLRSLGYRVLRYSGWQIREQPGLVIADLTRELGLTA